MTSRHHMQTPLTPEAMSHASELSKVAQSIASRPQFSANIKTWQERVDWLNDRPAPALMVEAMKAEIADLRAALAAKAVPDGWKLVPIEPTCEMIDAFHEADDAAFAEGSQHGVGICMAWDAMLDAAPSPAENSHE